jgi:release factor glutamine methyltransferase
VKRSLWRLLIRARYLIFQRHRHDRLVVEHQFGYPLLVLPGVFNPTLFRTTPFVVECLRGGLIPEGVVVLDLGTGTGVLAIEAARTARRVVAADLNPEAIHCARVNAVLARVDDRIELRGGDLFAAVEEERFDVVICNPPFYPGRPETPIETAFFAEDFAERFAADLPAHLAPGGKALVVLSTEGDERGFLDAFSAAQLRFDVVVERDLVSETLRLYAVRSGRSA